MMAFEIRAVLPGDEEQILSVARHLDSVNLPNDAAMIAETVDKSYRSFTGQIANPKQRQYVFVLVDRATKAIIGTSMVLAQLGSKEAPYIYVDVLEQEKYSATIDKHFHHSLLRTGYCYDGPTEIGGLVLLPEYRLAENRLGTMISYVRFLYMAAHRDLFEDEVLAELMPPLEPDGTSLLWEALGRRFTGMSYVDADRLSKRNKEFIKSLFPEEVIYASVLSEAAQGVLGKTGVQTRGVEKLLRRIGFRYADRVDPFDGGPHYTARMDEISLVERTRRTTAARPMTAAATDKKALVAVDLAGPPFFRAVLTPYRDEGASGIAVASDAWEVLGLHATTPVMVLPIE